MERTTVENLKELIRAGRAKTPATKVNHGRNSGQCYV